MYNKQCEVVWRFFVIARSQILQELVLVEILVRARSQIPVFGLTGRAPGWPGAWKLPGASV